MTNNDLARTTVGVNSVLHNPNQAPFFKHDCEACIHLTSTQFVGRDSDTGSNFDEKYDLYFCGASSVDSTPTIIVRYSDEPSDNASGLEVFEASYNRSTTRRIDYTTYSGRNDIVRALGYHLSIPMITKHEREVEADRKRTQEKINRSIHSGYLELAIAFKALWEENLDSYDTVDVLVIIKECYVWDKESLENLVEYKEYVETYDNPSPELIALFDATIAFAESEV